MYQRVKMYVIEHHMLEKSDRVVIGVSGGADSICLLFVLARLKKEIGFAMKAVHIHHGLRGTSADADAMYVAGICKEWKVELTTCYKDVRAYAQDHRMSLEEAGREVRRISFLDVCETWNGTKIALAHHQNDNVETLLWNLCRGTGLRGLGGIEPQKGMYIRPLLCLKRKEVESYLEEWGISYCTDETNLEDDYTRNRIRHQMVPFLEEKVNIRSVEHMNETMEQMRLLEQYVEEQVGMWEEKCVRCTSEGNVILKDQEFTKVPLALKSYILHRAICSATGRCKDVAVVHVKMIDSLLMKQVGRTMHFPYGVVARRSYEGVLLTKERKEDRKIVEELPEITTCILEEWEDRQIFPETLYTKWFDYDIIKNTVKIRHRMPGDYITIDCKGNTQKLKQYFINNKIPQAERDQIWLAADGQHIMWVIGYRQNQAYQISEHTKKILEVKMNGGKLRTII